MKFRNLFLLFTVCSLVLLVAFSVVSENEKKPLVDDEKSAGVDLVSDMQRPGFAVPMIPFQPKHYIVYHTDEPIEIDGRIDEDAWAKAEWTDYFVDIEGHLKPSPRYRTRAKMLWDDNYFYFAAELEEPNVWATLTERNSVIFHDNNFEIFIDPNGDTHNYFEFEINAFETIWDLFLTRPYRDGTQVINQWNLLDYQAGVYIDGEINNPGVEDNKWTVEVALPWSALQETAPGRRPPRHGEQWRVNFSRVQWLLDVVDNEYQKRINPETGNAYPEDNWVWSPQGLVNMHYPEMWGFAQFSENIAGEAEDEFEWNRDEEIKWALRQVYYAQRNYRSEHGVFADDFRKLNMALLEIEGYVFNPTIEVTSNMYEAIAESFDGERTWHIRQDGRIWRQ